MVTVMVFLSKPFSLNSYESTKEPTRPRFASLSGLSSLVSAGDSGGECGEKDLPASIDGVVFELGEGYGSPGLSGRWLLLVARFFSPGGKGLLS